MPTDRRDSAKVRFHFTLTGAQAESLVDLVNGLELSVGLRKRHPLTAAADALDEQMAQQTAPWERCSTCGGSGWVEDA